MNELLGRVLLTHRAKFLHKLSALEDMVAYLETDFRAAAEDLGMGASLRPEVDWRNVDVAHYDLNTCFRETQVLLRSFLVSLPDDQLANFQRTASEQMRAPELSNHTIYVAQVKRMAAAGGK